MAYKILEVLQQDASFQKNSCDWVIAINEAILKELKGDLKYRYNNLINIDVKIEVKCTPKPSRISRVFKSKPVNEHIDVKTSTSTCLKLPVIDSATGQPLHSLGSVINNYFTTDEEQKHCNICKSKSRILKETRSLKKNLPSVLMIWYMRGYTGCNNLFHKINCDTSLNIFNMHYELTGVLLYRGHSMKQEHNIAITRCCLTDICTLWQNNQPTIIKPTELSNYTKEAYMLMFQLQDQERDTQGPRTKCLSTDHTIKPQKCKEQGINQPVAGPSRSKTSTARPMGLRTPGSICSDQRVLRLTNPNNSCYAIGVLNMMLSCPPFIHLLQHCQLKPDKGDFVKELRYLMTRGPNEIDYVEALRVFAATGATHTNTDFTNSEQHDAAEFLETMMDCLKNELTTSSQLNLEELFKTIIKEERNCILKHIYECEKKETSVSHPYMLSLPVQNSKSLAQSMAMFLGEETINVTCGNGHCNSEQAELTSSLYKMPLALVIQLKRSVPNPQIPNTMMKLKNQIRVPARYLFKPGYPQYILTGALVQIGEEAGSGHYVSLTHDVEQDCFILADDDKPLRWLTRDEFRRKIGYSYMLIYCREDYKEQGWKPEAVQCGQMGISPPSPVINQSEPASFQQASGSEDKDECANMVQTPSNSDVSDQEMETDIPAQVCII